MKACPWSDKYKAFFAPRCNKGLGCDACNAKWNMKHALSNPGYTPRFYYYKFDPHDLRKTVCKMKVEQIRVTDDMKKITCPDCLVGVDQRLEEGRVKVNKEGLLKRSR